jgi:2'-5' RNA ligase
MAMLLSGIEDMPTCCDATVERFLGLPTHERPRVLAARLDTMGVLERLAVVVNRRLAPEFGPPDRPFIPHVSLARLARRTRPLAAVPPLPNAFSVRLVDFGAYRSELLSGGARYTRLMPMG